MVVSPRAARRGPPPGPPGGGCRPAAPALCAHAGPAGSVPGRPPPAPAGPPRPASPPARAAPLSARRAQSPRLGPAPPGAALGEDAAAGRRGAGGALGPRAARLLPRDPLLATSPGFFSRANFPGPVPGGRGRRGACKFARQPGAMRAPSPAARALHPGRPRTRGRFRAGRALVSPSPPPPAPGRPREGAPRPAPGLPAVRRERN